MSVPLFPSHKFIGLADVAARTGMPVPTLRRWLLAGRTPPAMLICHRYVWDRDVIEPWIEVCREARQAYQAVRLGTPICSLSNTGVPDDRA
jgi:predicted DNA-binding transcriptional regulator AlpA